MSHRSLRPPLVAGPVFLSLALGIAARAEERPPDPLDPASAVPPVEYRSELPATRGAYVEAIDQAPLPWRKLFHPDGRFVDEAVLEAHGTHEVPAPAPAPDTGSRETALAPGGSDARALVRAVDLANGKVKLKHGPIPKLDMPGMTMVFRVKDPSLLERVKKGDEVGFTLEVDGGVFYVTGFQE